MASTCPVVRRQELLQWGRDQLVAEMEDLLCDVASSGVASMGPRPIGRGNADGSGAVPRGRPASMGPRPIGRGNAAEEAQRALVRAGFNGAATNWSRKYWHIQICRQGHIRFNGAATNWSRKSPVRALPIRASLSLQWGRDQLVAEILASSSSASLRNSCFNGAATNWSRKFRPFRLVAHRSRRFNGAATNWSRKSRRMVFQTQKVPGLQWGRDQLVAEIARADLMSASIMSLQWGRDQLVAEMTILALLRHAEAGFNGAATNWSRKCWRGSCPLTRSISCFNGAATNWSRK